MPRKRDPTSPNVLKAMGKLDQHLAAMEDKKPHAEKRARQFLLKLAVDAPLELLLEMFRAMAKWLAPK